MKDPIDVVDEVFVIALQVSQRLDASEEFKHLSGTFLCLSNQLSEEIADTDPLHLLWAGATIQAIQEELMEAADECSSSSHTDLTEYLDNCIEKITETLLGNYIEDPEQKEDYGTTDQNS